MEKGGQDIKALLLGDEPYIFTTASNLLAEAFVTATNVSLAANGTNFKDPCKAKVSAEYLIPWRRFTFWCLAHILPIGLILNCVSIGVYMTSWMRRGVPGRYFIALLFADNLVLLGELLLWLNTNIDGPVLGLNFIHQFDFFCKATYFIRYGARMWSSWITVAITVERFLTVTFPLKMVRLSSPRKAVMIIVTIGIICFSCGSFSFFTLGAKPYRGRPLCQYTNMRMYTIWTMVVISIFGEMVVPSVIVSVFTALIIWRLAIARRERLRMVEGSVSNHSPHMRQKSSEKQPTIALLCIAITFVTIRLPYIVMYFINAYKDTIWDCLNKWQSFDIYILYTVAKVLAVLNYSLNFCLYCISGASFRKELKRCITCRRYQRQTIRTGSYVMSTRINRDSCAGRALYNTHSPTLEHNHHQPCLRNSSDSNNQEKNNKLDRKNGMNHDEAEKVAMLRSHDSLEDDIKDYVKDCDYTGVIQSQKDRAPLVGDDSGHTNANQCNKQGSYHLNRNPESLHNAPVKSKGLLVVMETKPNGIVTRL